MMRSAISVIVASFVPFSVLAQDPATTPANQSQVSGAAFTADYPANQAGVLVRNSGWSAVTNQFPAKSKVAHAFAAGISYGLAPAKIVADYDGEHAPTQTDAAQPVFCICHMISLPGTPVIVRLHPKKGARELDGGKMVVYPVVGGSKMADANKTDLIPADVSQPEPQVWLVRPQVALEPGEYALMLGTQNMNVYPFTIASPTIQQNPNN